MPMILHIKSRFPNGAKCTKKECFLSQNFEYLMVWLNKALKYFHISGNWKPFKNHEKCFSIYWETNNYNI